MILSVLCKDISAQSFHGTLNSSMNITGVLHLSLTNNSSTNINLNAGTLSSGYIQNGFSSIKVKSNEPWMLTVQAGSNYFSASGTYASPDMPASVLTLSSPQKQVILSSTAQTLAEGNRGNTGIPGNSFNLNLKADPGYNYGPGIYSINLVYTLTSR